MPYGRSVRTELLTPGSPEYLDVEKLFHITLSGENIVKIERIQNPLLYQTYMVRKQKLDKDIGRNSERKLFHGTDCKNISQINSWGFNRSYAGINGKLTIYQMIMRHFECEFNRCQFQRESAIRKKMAPLVAFWVARHVGPKSTVFVWESDGK